MTEIYSTFECCPLGPEVQGPNTSPGRFSLLSNFMLGPPDVIPLPVDQRLSSVVEGCHSAYSLLCVRTFKTS